MSKDYNEIAKIEKAIGEKYGSSAVQNPKSSWTEEKEKKYLKDLKKFYKIEEKKDKKIVHKDGFTVRGRPIATEERSCPICSAYSHSTRDNLYMNKFTCCEECYINYIEGREERWKNGWRPNI